MFTRFKRLSNKRKEIAIIDNISNFIKYILSRADIDKKYKVFALLALSGAARTTEILNLTKESFVEQNGCLFFKIGVLKKRKNKLETRWARVHPDAENFIKSHLDSSISGPLIRKTDSALRKQTKRYFQENGTCNHMYRHSGVSYMLFQAPKKLTHIEVSKLLHVSVNVITAYAHLDERAALKELY